jgi:hypothetical protein
VRLSTWRRTPSHNCHAGYHYEKVLRLRDR